MVNQSKRIRLSYEKIERHRHYSLSEGIKIIKNQPPVRFDQMCEVAINLNINPRKTEQNLRGVVSLPHGNGKVVRVAVFAKGPKAQEALDSGAEVVGAEDLIEKIQQGGEIPFDRCIATPDMMVSLSKIAKILGSRGLMPNPKAGTITMEVGNAVKNIKTGTVEYRTDKGGIIHLGVGKISFSPEKLSENIKVLLSHISKSRPAGVKGVFIKKVTLSSTMGVGLNIDLATLQQ